MLVLQQVASVALAAGVLWTFARNRPRLGFSREAFTQLLGFGVRTTSVNLVFFSIQRLFVIGVGGFLGAEAAGYATLAFRCVDMLRDLAAGAILQLSLPVFSRLQDDRDALERHFTAAVEVSAATMFPVFVGLAVTAPEVVALLFGSKWAPSAPYVALLAILSVQYFARMLSTPLVSALGRPHYSLASGMAQLLFVAVGLVTVGRLSVDWAMAVWAGRLLVFPIDFVMVKRASGIGGWRQIRGAVPILGITLAMAAVVLAVKLAALDLSVALRLPAMVAVGVVTYALLLWTLRRSLVERMIGLALATFREDGVSNAERASTRARCQPGAALPRDPAPT